MVSQPSLDGRGSDNNIDHVDDEEGYRHEEQENDDDGDEAMDAVPEMAMPAINSNNNGTARSRNKANIRNDSNKLSVVSRQYDRGGKGYLDKTEQKLRSYDRDNDGRLGLEEVYALMQDFQETQHQALTLKWVVIALSGFAVLLCLANVGTSFAAATLAKDVTTSPDGRMVGTKEGVGNLATANREEILDLDVADGSATPPIAFTDSSVGNGTHTNSTGPPGRGRLLYRRQFHRGLHMDDVAFLEQQRQSVESGNSRGLQVSKVTVNRRQGNFQITQSNLNRLMTSFCQKWPGVRRYGCNGLSRCGNGAGFVRLMYGW